MNGKLIVIEGIDGSGKQTQSNLLYNALKAEKKDCIMKLSFPDYRCPSSEPLKMYLSGEFGSNAQDVSPYAASTFFGVNRFSSYKKRWERDYKAGKIIIADRYTTANAVHQASKLDDQDRNGFFEWLYDFEFNKLGLPKPDLVILLDMPAEASARLTENRRNKFTGSSQKDIHEKDFDYLKKSEITAKGAAQYLGWKIISCIKADGAVKTINEIHTEVLKTVCETIFLEG